MDKVHLQSVQNLRELRMNVVLRFTICRNREIRERQFSLFFVILSEKLAKFCMISCDIAKITGIGRTGFHNSELMCNTIQ